MAVDFPFNEFKGEFNAFDKMEALPKLARIIYGLTDVEQPEKKSRRNAMRLAEKYLPILRREIATLEGGQ